MLHLYTSTDEANHLIDAMKGTASEITGYKYHYIDPKHGKEIEKRIGFNPMSSIEFNVKLSVKTKEIIAKEFVSKGLFAAFESESEILKYIPQDIEARNELVKLALRKGRYDQFPIFLYSNNPNEIKEFEY
ncbi:MAG: hypothetical protein NTY20_01915 [Candidatus Aenigmarchaeota archaeon]|nr:hypothetical protein [Candidatus Aenigmarchaeota archaeon]